MNLSQKSVTADPLFPLEKRLLKVFSAYRQSKCLVAVSGGRDSVVLIYALARLKARLHLDLAIAHIHHGPSAKTVRDRAQKFVTGLANSLDLEILTETARVPLKSESQLREFRYHCLRRWQAEHGFNFIVLAHHADDLLETRLIRLIRGTGPQGLQGMSLQVGHLLRPLLAESADELRHYAELRKLMWLDDPSNLQLGFLRNWIRGFWLPELELKRPGAKNNLARSLEHLVQAVGRDADIELPLASDGLDRAAFARLDAQAQRALLAKYLRHAQVRGFTTAHLDEIRKRLKTERKSFVFSLLRHEWTVNAQQIKLQRPDQKSHTPDRTPDRT